MSGTDDSGDTPEGRDETRSKVGRLIAEHGLDGIAEELERRWLGVEGERESLRDLADYFNRRLLKSELAGADVQTLAGEVENTYRLLTDSDVSAGMRTEVRNRLAENGLDVDRLEREFVSHQAIHTYLTEYREVSLPSRDDTDQVQKGRETIQRLENRVVAVVQRTLDNLRNTERITLGGFDVLVDIRVSCRDCGTVRSVADLLDDGGCDCRE
jgi:hypothetical protein